jgi:AmmeMemoRadiSam system protein B
MDNNYREASHSGTWYSGDPKQLTQEIEKFLNEAQKNPDCNNVRSIIVPHAGYRYSGPTAGWAYININPENFNRVVLLGPSHSVYLPGIGIPTSSRYETPVGDISLDLEEIKKLSTTEEFYKLSKEADEKEHSLEMQFPFLRYMFGEKDFKLIPLMVGQTTLDQDRKFAKILVEYYKDPQTLFVISSDFCHWGSRFRYTYYDNKYKSIHESIEALDRTGMDCIESLVAENFQKYLEEYKNTICGRRPISILMATIEEYMKFDDKKKNVIKFVRYDQSDKVKDFSGSSVSYAAGINIIYNN